MREHRLDDQQPHAFWDNAFPPRLRVAPGDTVVFETLEGAGQIGPNSTHQALAELRAELIHPLTGPVWIEGAMPGDTLEVEVLSLRHKNWGWNGVIPGFGLLAEEFDRPYLHHYALEGEECLFADDIRIPYEPFCGVMGVTPAESRRFDTTPPRRNGGNVDIRHLTAGAHVLLPVLGEGALFSCGDCHAAQGDGEVNGTGIESPMQAKLRFCVHSGIDTPQLRFTAQAPLTRGDTGSWFATTADGPDLFADAQQATRYMLDYLGAEHALTREEAYCLCGAVVDLRISELVDEPNWIVSAYLPLSIFR